MHLYMYNGISPMVYIMIFTANTTLSLQCTCLEKLYNTCCDWMSLLLLAVSGSLLTSGLLTSLYLIYPCFKQNKQQSGFPIQLRKAVGCHVVIVYPVDFNILQFHGLTRYGIVDFQFLFFTG